MNFTKQQLTGGAVYDPRVKLGNFVEDRARAELEAKDFELRKSRGQLATFHKQKLAAIAGQTVCDFVYNFMCNGIQKLGSGCLGS